MSKPRNVRLFLGAEVSMATVKALSGVAESMRRAAYDAGFQIRWVAPATYHVTLKFLGSTPVETLEAIRDRLAPPLAAVAPFDFTAARVGAFPDARDARVVWAGIDDPTGSLFRIAEIIESELEGIGFPREARAFHPHVTLGRVKRVDDVTSVLRPSSERIFSTTRLTRIVLYESITKPSGSEYVIRGWLNLGTALESNKRHTEHLQRSSEDGPERESEEELVDPAEPGESGPMDSDPEHELRATGDDHDA